METLLTLGKQEITVLEDIIKDLTEINNIQDELKKLLEETK